MSASAPAPKGASPSHRKPGTRSEETRERGGFVALKSINYRWYFSGQVASVIGTWMQSLALSWLVITTLDGSPFDLGLVNALNFVPVLVLSLYAGVIADRVNKLNLVNAMQAVNLVLAAAQAVLIVIDRATIPQVYAFALLLGASNAFQQPARQAMTSELVERRHLLNAISLNSALFNMGRVVGPSIAGVLIWQFGPAICFAINAVCYAIGIVLFRRINLPYTPRAGREDGFQRLREGLAFVGRTESVLLPTILIGFVATFAMNFNIWIPLLATETFGLGSSGFGILTAVLGVGSLLGALSLAFSRRSLTRRQVYLSAVALGGVEVALAVMSASVLPLALIIPVLIAAGYFMSSTSAAANTIVQSSTPDALRGRVMSVYMTVFTGTIPIGSLMTGWLAGHFSAPAAIGIGGAVAGVCAVVILIWREGLLGRGEPASDDEIPDEGPTFASRPDRAPTRTGQR
ncbi:MAG TPA: MFS transporter [Thermomicrobiales bacterium]|jgi:MFS family permease|nr:MFS transporter [Thermomicrobiales bacterium]